MNKQKIGRKFHRQRDQRKALMRSLARNLILNEAIQTTHAKAKELRPFIEKLITKARVQNVATLRYLRLRMDDTAMNKLVKKIAPKYADRPGGYTRITKLTASGRNAASNARIEFV